MDKLILDLFEIGAFQFGKFRLKSGKKSPFYIDLRLLISHPDVLLKVAEVYTQVLKKLKFDRIAAVPYAAIPIATAICLKTKTPMIYLRKETKKYGLMKEIEGKFKTDEKVVVIDDMVTTGESKLEAIEPLRKAGLRVEDVVVLIDREQGAKETLRKSGYKLHSFIGFRAVLEKVLKAGKISKEVYSACQKYLDHESY